MIADIEKRVAKLRNELKAQKVNSGLAYSQLLLPENTPTQSYSSTASLSNPSSGPVARMRFRFTRTDGLIDSPAINFAFSYSASPTYAGFVRAQGFTISGNDLDYFDTWSVSGYIHGVGDGYVDFYVDLSSELRDAFFSLSTISFSITCQAITNVKGDLTVERLI
ncbi:MAG: hypothetical protein U0L97_02865 [Candidatus Saccharimonadaceae bacterium]|nr:hypothetical protein [Candidatus Saccharimonadaceae bacterium]